MAPSGGNEPQSVITFHSPIRTFNRIFSENSLQEMKDAVRKKLGLSSALPIHLDHLQGEYCIALEDDDDFNAFHLLAKSMASLVVRVTVGGTADETRNGETITTATHLPPINSSSEKPSSLRPRRRKASISKAGFTSQNFRVIEYAGPSAETSMRGPTERGKRKRIADEDSLKANTGNNIALEPAPAADVTASPKRKKLKRSTTTARTSDSINDVDMLSPPEESSGAAPKKRKEEVGDSTSKGPTSSDLHLSIKTVKSKKGGKASIIPDRTDEVETDSPPAAAEVQVSKKKTHKKKAMEAESLHTVSPSADPDIPGASKSSAEKASRVSNTIKKNTGLAPEVPISESLSTATKKGKKKKEKKTLLPNEGEAEETVVDAYDKFFRSGQELDHEVPSQAALSSKNAKKRPTEITKPDEDSTNSNRIGQRKTKKSDAETSKRHSTTEELEAAQATIRAAIAQKSSRRKQAAVDDAVTTDIGLSTDASKATSPSIADGPPTATVQVAEIKTSSTSTSKQAKQSRQLKKVPLHAPLERHSSPAASTTEIDVFGPVTSPASVAKKGSGSGPKNNGRKSGSSPEKSRSSRDVPMKAMISGDDEELRALIRGPQRGRVDVGQILSVAAAGGDEDDAAGELEEDEEIQPRYCSFAAADASSSEEEIEDDDSPDVVSETDRQTSVPLVAPSISHESSATDSNDAASKDAEQRAGDDGHPVNSVLVPDTPEEESPASPISPKPPTEPEPGSPIESFDEPQQALQTHVGSPPRRPNGLLKRMKGKSASLSPQQSRLRPMLSKIGKLNGVSEETDSEAQKIASQLPPTESPALPEPIDLDNVPMPVSAKPRRQSLDTWAILKPSSPNTDADSSMNIDELVSVNYDEVTSSTPNDRRLAFQATTQQMAEGASSLDSHDSQPTDDPLFIPSESQHPFPYSQYQAVSAHDSEDEDEVEATVKSGPDVTASSFRRLTDIGSQRTFFSSQPPGWQKADFSRPTLQDLYGNGPDDESDSSDGDSDGGGERTSHIPQSRRAGAK
ncbi:uncharacterized protein ARMOST_00796 [Armillaria ostoyae]|uniref:Uncharacterized protein n=1 Tax=Armillaria ostoyae TaxID=47428 RepID=A0A284QM50_ARMOS|nr:uncharacterized protein ARMOST_00796 [Armillaria ostoyae]